MATASSSSTVVEGFQFETKYVVLSYLGLQPPSSLQSPCITAGEGEGQSSQEQDRSRIKGQVEEELRRLEEEVVTSFSTTGFDCHTSLVFSPANPESPIEDCLAVLGSRVAQDLGPHLIAALQALSGVPLDYERYRDAVQDVFSHSQGGWSKVLVPLVLLQALLGEGQPLTTLVPLGVRYLLETEADFIIQQGGWGTALSLEDVDPSVIVAEDANDIYILSGEQLSPPASLVSAAEGSEHRSWQSDSLPVSLVGTESWSQVGTMDPEDMKSLDSDGGTTLGEERSENNSSNSDIVHVEREEVELAEEGELQESMLDSKSEPGDVRVEISLCAEPPSDIAVAAGSPLSMERLPMVQATPSPQATEPATPEPPPNVPSSVSEPKSPTSVPGPLESEMPAKPEVLAEPPQKTLLPEGMQESVATPVSKPYAAPPEDASHKPKPEPPTLFEFPMLLYSGAALVAIAAVVYGAMAYRKK